jgi:protein CpxP
MSLSRLVVQRLCLERAELLGAFRISVDAKIDDAVAAPSSGYFPVQLCPSEYPFTSIGHLDKWRKKMKIPIALLSVTMAITMAGALMAQKTLPAPAPSVTRSDRMVQRLTKRLNLTADQQARVKAIFADSSQQAKAFAPQLREERAALKAAVRSDSESQIDQITQKNAQLTAQLEAVHVKTMAKVYATLTPDQKAKFDHMDARREARFRRNSQARS